MFFQAHIWRLWLRFHQVLGSTFARDQMSAISERFQKPCLGSLGIRFPYWENLLVKFIMSGQQDRWLTAMWWGCKHVGYWTCGVEAHTIISVLLNVWMKAMIIMLLYAYQARIWMLGSWKEQDYLSARLWAPVIWSGRSLSQAAWCTRRGVYSCCPVTGGPSSVL